MAKGKHKNLTNRNQEPWASSELSTPTLSSPGHTNTLKNLDPDLKAYLMMMVEDIKKDFNNSIKIYRRTLLKSYKSLKKKQENTTKQVEVLKEKQENASKLVMEMNKRLQDLKREVDTIEKTQSEATLEMKH
jgi:hypothetical protein